MSPRRHEQGSQPEALFEAAILLGHQGDENTDDYKTDDVDSSLPEVTAEAIDIRERAQLLLGAATFFAEANKLAGLRKAVKTNERERIRRSIEPDHGLEGMTEGARFKSLQDVKLAKSAFLAAYNLGLVTQVTSKDEDFDIAFTEFSQRYGIGANPSESTRKSENRVKLVKSLISTVAIDGSFKPDTYALEIPETPTPVLKHEKPQPATSHDKLIGLRDDERAGFLPTTHKEKSQAFELLDYMDKDKHPKGVDQRLTEVFNRQQKIADRQQRAGRAKYDFAMDSVRSILYEWGDYYIDARTTYQELVRMKEQLDSGISPRISLNEATEPEGEKTFDYNPLVRFVHLSSIRDGTLLAFDPLRTRQDRSIDHPGKNKIVQDSHNALGSLDEVQNFIDEAATALSVKDSRRIIDSALADQLARGRFWLTALSAVEQDGFKQRAQSVLREIG